MELVSKAMDWTSLPRRPPRPPMQSVKMPRVMVEDLHSGKPVTSTNAPTLPSTTRMHMQCSLQILPMRSRKPTRSMLLQYPPVATSLNRPPTKHLQTKQAPTCTVTHPILEMKPPPAAMKPQGPEILRAGSPAVEIQNTGINKAGVAPSQGSLM